MEKTLRARVSLRNPLHFTALGFGAGLIPIAPGTFGSMVAIPLLLLCANLSMVTYLSLTLAGFVFGIGCCRVTARALRMHDHGSIVWDEIVGMFVTFVLIPISGPNLLLGFVLFRLFDILKPWPIRLFDKKVHGGTGIMLDDIVAGALACLVLHAIQPVLTAL